MSASIKAEQLAPEYLATSTPTFCLVGQEIPASRPQSQERASSQRRSTSAATGFEGRGPDLTAAVRTVSGAQPGRTSRYRVGVSERSVPQDHLTEDHLPEDHLPEDHLPEDEPDLSDVIDELPEDLDREFATPYEFPDNKRRRVPGLLYIALAAATFAIASFAGDDAILINRGLVIGAIALVVIGLYHLFAALPLVHDENDALVVATRAVGFPVGHASAQLGWRGLRSRPIWKILLYSAEDPPEQRGLVLVDAVTGATVDQLIEANPEDWTGLASADGTVRAPEANDDEVG